MNCSLELRLNSNHLRPNSSETPQRGQSKEMSIFYYDIAELQARAVLLLASEKTEQRLRNSIGFDDHRSSFANNKSTFQSHPLFSPRNGVSMKRSLQRFFNRRKLRNQASSPYHHSCS